MELKVIKQGNLIEDTCIAYGVCKILDDNDIEFNLADKKSFYSIECEEFDELEYIDTNIEDCWNVNWTLNLKETTNNIDKMNSFLNENIQDIFNNYLQGKQLENKYKDDNCITIGNCFYGVGIRASTTQKVLKINPINKWLSFLGWLYGASYCNNDDIESTVIMTPKNTNEIKKPFNFTYVDKETGNKKVLTKLKSETEVSMMARLYLETYKKYSMLNEEYDSIMFLKNKNAGNKPMADEMFKLDIKNISIDLCEEFLKKIYCSKTSIGSKDLTSKFILNNLDYRSFRKMIRQYAKEDNMTIENNIKEEILNMYNSEIRNIYKDDCINKLSKGLKILLNDKKGYDIQVKLYGVRNERQLLKCIRDIINSYYRYYNESSLINDEQIESIFNLLNDKKDCEIIADAILSLSKIFFNKNIDK